MVTVPVRGLCEGFGAMARFTTPLPVPLAPPVTVIQLALLVAVQLQFVCVVTDTVRFAAPAPVENDVGSMANSHGGCAEHVANASVSWIGANFVPTGFVYCFETPVSVSVMLRVVCWSVRPPAKTQKRLFTAQPSSTFTTASTLELPKNQK